MTDPWGIKVSAVVISGVILPAEMQRAIAKQAEAAKLYAENSVAYI